MILTRAEIDREVAQGAIVINPYVPTQLNPNSYNYRLGSNIKEVHPENSLGNSAANNPLLPIDESGTVIAPGRVYLSNTLEVIGSRKYVISLIGRSSIGRLGLYVQLSADLGNLGDAHRWTLELTCVQPMFIYPGMIMGQISFWETHGAPAFYSGPYTRFSQPTGNIRDLT
jgi:dCTP deaminase